MNFHSDEFFASDIERVTCCIEQAKALIEQQSALVERLEHKGLPTAAARSVLRTLLGSLYVLQQTLDRLEAEEKRLTELPPHPDKWL